MRVKNIEIIKRLTYTYIDTWMVECYTAIIIVYSVHFRTSCRIQLMYNHNV